MLSVFFPFCHIAEFFLIPLNQSGISYIMEITPERAALSVRPIERRTSVEQMIQRIFDFFLFGGKDFALFVISMISLS